MRMLKLAVVGALVVACADRAGAQSCPLLVLQRDGQGFVLQRDTIPDGEAVVYVWNPEFVTVVLPWAPGQSGDVVQASRGPGATAVRCREGSLTATVQSPGSEPRVLPAVEAAASGRFRIRVSVTPGRGRPAVFIVHPDGSIARDTLAPPTDMFRGTIPLSPGDVSVTTEIRAVEVGARVTGSIELRRGGPYFLARVSVPGGGTGDVIVDLGASRTLLSRELLPPGAELTPLSAIEHGPAGERELAGSLGAFGGEVGDVAWTRLEELRLGDLGFRDVRVNVVPRLPPIAGQEVVGILGADILQRAAVTRIHESSHGRRLEFAPEPLGARPHLEAPFSLVGGLVVLSGSVDGHTIPLILDTGARATLIAESSARELGLRPQPGEGQTFRGLDGRPMETWPALIPSLRLGDGSLDSLRVNVGDLTVLERMGLTGGGLLGQDLWERFTTLEVDWSLNVVRWFP